MTTNTYKATASDGKIYTGKSNKEKTHAVIFYKRNGIVICDFYISFANGMKQMEKHHRWQRNYDFGDHHIVKMEIVKAEKI